MQKSLLALVLTAVAVTTSACGGMSNKYIVRSTPPNTQNVRVTSDDCKSPITESGIVNNSQAPFRAMTFVGINRWQGIVDGQEIIAFAGKSGGQDESQGVVILEQRNQGCYVGTFTYPTPPKRGAVKVTAETGGRLTLQSDQGSTFTFDLLSRTYVEN